MADRAWKASERRMAEHMGTKRIPCTGERNGADFENKRFCFQLKVRSMLPKWMWDWLEGIVSKAAEKGKIGVLVLRLPRQRDDDALVVLKWSDWRRIKEDLDNPRVVISGQAGDIRIDHLSIPREMACAKD